MLTANVKLHAINAIIRIAQRALTLPQTTLFLSVTGPTLQAPELSVKAVNARARFADSKMIKKRSSNTSRILVLGDRRPNGLPVYSSYVMYNIYGMATTSTTMAMVVEAF